LRKKKEKLLFRRLCLRGTSSEFWVVVITAEELASRRSRCRKEEEDLMAGGHSRDW